MNNIEEIIKGRLKANPNELKRSPGCPPEIALARYLDGVLSAAERKRIEEHLADCNYCLDLLVVAREVRKEDVRNKVSWPGEVKKQKWLVFTAASFILSFLVKRYFLQFLTLSLILGVKWALSGEGSRNLVMIFRSLNPRDTGEKEKKAKIYARK